MNPYNNPTLETAASNTDALSLDPTSPSARASTSFPPSSDGKLQHVLDTMKNISQVTGLLRLLGAILLIASMSIFLMKGWQDGSDIKKYFLLLAQTGLLTAGGFGVSSLLKDGRGARLFFGLSLSSVAVNFTILGALVYSVFSLDLLPVNHASFAMWAADASGVTLTLLVALAALVPIVWIGYTVLARASAKWLSVTYLISSAMLLIPLRDSFFACALALISLAFVMFMLHKNDRDDETRTTLEGRFARLMLFVPAFILAFRSLYFYDINTWGMSFLYLGAVLLCRHFSISMDESSKRRAAVDLLSALFTLLFGACFVTAIGYSFTPAMLAPIFALCTLPLIYELLSRNKNTKFGDAISCMTAILMGLTLVFNELFYANALASIIALLTMAAITAHGYWMQRKATISIGGTALLIVMAVNALALWKYIDLSNWVLMSTLGCSAIVIASVLDRHGAGIKMRFEKMRQQLVIKEA